MSPPDPQAALIRETFHKLQPQVALASLEFYKALFQRAPHLEKLFRDDLAGQGMKFMTTLGFIVENMASPEKLDEKLSELGRVHGILGVKAADFEPMGEALMQTFRNELGEDFTPEAEAAWRAAYADLSNRIIALGGIA